VKPSNETEAVSVFYGGEG